MTTFNEYQYAPIRLKLLMTGEVFNVGIIIMDENGRSKKIKTIDSFKSISKCLKIDNCDSHNYALEQLHKQFNNGKLKFGEYFSNSIYVEKLSWLNSKKDIEEELEITFTDMVTLSPHEEKL